jgi:uronate dehydrogenase
LVPAHILADRAADRTAADGQEQPKRVLVTAAETRLAQTLGDGMPAAWQVHLTAATQVSVSRPFRKCGLEADEATRDVVRGMDAIVHLALAGTDQSPGEQIDALVRATYNLLTAAAAEGVRRVVHVSSLSALQGYDEAFTVTEDWQPRPADDAPALAEYLAEYTSREFARQRQLEVVALRIGKVVRAESIAGSRFDPLWVDERDVAQAVALALRTSPPASPRGTDGWAVFHILSDSPRARFSIDKARQLLGYQPQYRW